MLTATWADAGGAQHNRAMVRVAKTRVRTLAMIPPRCVLDRNFRFAFRLRTNIPHLPLSPERVCRGRRREAARFGWMLRSERESQPQDRVQKLKARTPCRQARRSFWQLRQHPLNEIKSPRVEGSFGSKGSNAND